MRYLTTFLASSEFIDWRHPLVAAVSHNLSVGAVNSVDIARRCYEFVRDEIRHSGDWRLNPVTCRASDVLEYGTGYCYAKSHLLAALLRANAIPAALCYQQLSRGGSGPPYCLHGLNAVWLEDYGWYRIDARGNKPGIDARFSPPIERLAFNLQLGEVDLPDKYAEPLPEIVRILTTCATVDEVYENLLYDISNR